MTKKDYIISIRKILAENYLTEKARKETEKKFPIEKSPLWQYSIKNLRKMYQVHKYIRKDHQVL